MNEPAQRVLMTADTVGGVWNYCVELARGLQRRGVQTMIATMGPPASQSQRAEAQQIEGVTVVESGLKLEWMNEPWAEVDQAGEWLLRLEEQFKPDIIHLNGFSHGALAFEAPKVVVCHSDVISWWQAVKKEEAPAEYDVYRERVKAGLRGAQAVISPTNAMLQTIIRNFGPVKNAAVVLNGTHSGGYYIGEKENIIFSAGRLWDEAKNISLLSQAASGVPWRVMVAGDPGETRVPLNIVGLGKLDHAQMVDLYARASIYAMPARYEPFGLSILEAALSGCALVLGDIATLRELWEGAALFVDPKDPDELQKLLAHLCSDPGARQRLAEKAHYRAMQFSAELMAKRTFEVYHRAIGSTARDDVARRFEVL